MEKQDWLFASALMISFLAMLYFLGASVTGFVTQTGYCEDGECSDFCWFNTECNQPYDVCCDKGGFGVCQPNVLCQKTYMFDIASHPELDINNMPDVQKPNTVYMIWKPILLSVLLIAMLVIAIIYYSCRTKAKGKKKR